MMKILKNYIDTMNIELMPIMSQMLTHTYYAQNYAGIIYLSLQIVTGDVQVKCIFESSIF